MSKLKKFWIVFLSFLPLSAGAVAPLLLGLGAGLTAIAGFSIYRSVAPVNPADAFSFFSSCWTCGLFGDIISAMSAALPKIYHAIGGVAVPMMLALFAVWIAWTILSGWIGISKPDADPNDKNYAWSISGMFADRLFRVLLVSALLVVPLPRLITNAFVEPVFNIGLSISNGAANVVTPDSRDSIDTCVVSTIIADASRATPAPDAVFSAKLRTNLTCQIAGIHRLTGLGMTTGWTMMNMAFNSEYMYHAMFGVPIFPNIGYILVGAIILLVFFFALLPVPMYFLETIIKLSMDLIMLPLMLIGWVFDGWKILPAGKQNIKQMIDDVIQNTVGIAVTGVFIVFGIMFINALFGGMDGLNLISTAVQNNDAGVLMDGLKMQNNGLVDLVIAGIFIAMFMNAIPALIKALFSKVKIPDNFYKTAQSDAKKVWANAKKMWKKEDKK